MILKFGILLFDDFNIDKNMKDKICKLYVKMKNLSNKNYLKLSLKMFPRNEKILIIDSLTDILGF